MTIRLKLNHGGIAALLRSAEMQAVVNAEAQRILAATGDWDNFGMKSGVEGDRASAVVFTDTFRGRYHQARQHLLERAIGSGGG